MSERNNIHVLSRAVIINQDHILLCKTLNFPISFYFLPGGHVETGESAHTSLLRELVEETGAKCKILRFLGCLEYSFKPEHNSICHNHEYNFIFEVESDLLKNGYTPPQLEKNIELIWIPLEELAVKDFRAEPLKKLIPDWLAQTSSNSFISVMNETK